MSYQEKFPKGTMVQIVARQDLEEFRAVWSKHDPLQPEQLQYADLQGKISFVGFYHGGDVLYQVECIPGIWHECCLQLADTP